MDEWLQLDPHACSSVVSIKTARDGIERVVALGASKFKLSRHGTGGSTCKAPDNVQVMARGKVSRSMLLERAVGAEQARPRRELRGLEELNREPEMGPLVRNRPAEATQGNM